MKFVNRNYEWRQSGEEKYSALFAGDICLRGEGLEHLLNGGVEDMFEEVKPIFDSADLRMVQWETTITEAETPIDKSGPNLKVPLACSGIVKHLNADVALLANNHIGDFGPQVVMETIGHLEDAGCRTAGAGKDMAEAAAPVILECGNIRISLLNYAENEFGGAREDRAGVATMALLPILAQIREEKAKGNLVFVALHGGHEHNPFPSPRMVETFRAFVDAGADLLWNCHTHCPEGVEVWNGKPIVYSPGNFCFPARNPADSNPTWFCGYLTKFKFDSQGVYGMEIIPYHQTQKKILLFDEEHEKRFFDYLDELCAPLNDPAALQHWFDIWCSLSGLSYARGLGLVDRENWQPNWRDRGVVAHHMPVRNLFTCESHNDLLRRTFLLVERYQIEDLKLEQPKLEPFMKPTWFETGY